MVNVISIIVSSTTGVNIIEPSPNLFVGVGVSKLPLELYIPPKIVAGPALAPDYSLIFICVKGPVVSA